jgi:hemoglobin
MKAMLIGAILGLLSCGGLAQERATGARSSDAGARALQSADTPAMARARVRAKEAAAAPLDFPASGTLFQRLGGHAGVTAIVREATVNHLKNAAHASRFEAIKDPVAVDRQLVEYLSAGSGGPVFYGGKDMTTAHRGMNLSEQEFLAFLDDVMDSMDTLGVSTGAKYELLGLMFRLKEHIIRK